MEGRPGSHLTANIGRFLAALFFTVFIEIFLGIALACYFAESTNLAVLNIPYQE